MLSGNTSRLPREFQNATVRLDPNHAEAHNNLGAMLHAFGRLDEAAAEYRRAIELQTRERPGP